MNSDRILRVLKNNDPVRNRELSQSMMTERLTV